ncbi:MAG: hypothetical protein ACI9A7_000758 [Cyclobacteriaceae bacterium]|jgi:hypothetical protein
MIENWKNKIEQADKNVQVKSWKKEELWSAIESKQKKKQHHVVWLKYAAGIILLLSGIILFTNRPAENIVFSSVEFYEMERIEEYSDIEQGKAFIATSCQKELPICSSEEFLTIYSDLDLIEYEKEALLRQIDKYGQDEVMMDALIQIVNEETSLTGQLIQMILS